MPDPAQPLNLSGLAVDLPAYQYPPDIWTGGENVEMSEGFPRRARGFGRVFGGTLHVPRFLVNPQQAGTSLWVYGGDDAIAVTDAATHTDITGALVFDSTGAHSPWSGGVLNGRAILNNNAGVGAYWVPGAPAALILPDWPTDRRAGALRVFREYLVAMDITDGATRDADLIRWSDVAPPNDVPQSWTAGTQSQAGSASAAFTPGGLVDGRAIRDKFYIYKNHAVYVLSLIGGAFIMQQRPVFATFGALSRNCILEWRGKHIVLTDGDLVMHNGVEAESLIERTVRKNIFGNISGDNFLNSFLALDKERGEIWVCVPTGNNVYPDMAAVWSINDGPRGWGVRELGPNTWPHGTEGVVQAALAEPTWASRTTQWNTDSTRWNSTGTSPLQEKLLFGDAGSLLQAIGQLDTFDSVEPTARLVRTGLDFGSPDRFKYLSKIWPRVDGTPGSAIRVRAGSQETADGPITWDDWQTFNVGVDEAVDVDANGRYLAIEMESTTAANWRAPGLAVTVQESGGY